MRAKKQNLFLRRLEGLHHFYGEQEKWQWFRSVFCKDKAKDEDTR